MHTAVLACAPLLVTFTCSQFDVVASAQNAPAAKPTASKTSTFTATINTDGTLVRSAPNNETGYPFGSLSKGQTVTVVETQPGWVRVRTEGTSFEGWGGYVPALPGVALSADGKTGLAVALGDAAGPAKDLAESLRQSAKEIDEEPNEDSVFNALEKLEGAPAEPTAGQPAAGAKPAAQEPAKPNPTAFVVEAEHCHL